MNEFELIRILTQGLATNDSVRVGPGDDCAVIDLAVPDKQFLLKTDAVVQGFHFTAETPPEQVGHKALARCLSDLAAMGGTPSVALVTLALPQDFKPSVIESVYAGMEALGKRHGVAIVGGETTTNPERMLLSIAVLGSVPRDRYITRRGGQPGDAIFVTGELGGSLEGHHLTFEPRLTEGRWLAEHFRPNCMIDLSDGLAGDLRHLLHAPALGAEILLTAVPISRAAKRRSRAGDSAKAAWVAALTDGEDFELLFTVPSRQAVPLMDAWKTAFPSTRLSCIGRLRAAPGVVLRDKQGIRELKEHGYVHFS
ncbi:MAG: thiamine-phosphate kinase [Verrucomicrobiales bacterium]|nr:thiamine-phosphate kinase [Verrucomicrobiales bacterium]